MLLVNEVVMLLVAGQLSLVVIGFEDCKQCSVRVLLVNLVSLLLRKQWLVRFDPSFGGLMSVRVLLVTE